MNSSRFSNIALVVEHDCETRFPKSNTNFSRKSTGVEQSMALRFKIADEGGKRDKDWQRVNTYIADVLKDVHVLYSKLARLQGDFTGDELMKLEKISERILDVGSDLTSFMRDFHSGDASMASPEVYGNPHGGGGDGRIQPPQEVSDVSGDFESEIDNEDDDEFSDFKDESSDDEFEKKPEEKSDKKIEENT